MDVEGDGGYSDDDLDALPDDTFHELEEDAITATQQAAQAGVPQIPHHARPQVKASMPFARRLERSSAGIGGKPQQDFDYPQQPSSDYGDLDDETLDGEIYDASEEPGMNAIQASRAASIPYGESTQREHWRQSRYGMPLVHTEANFPQARSGPQIRNFEAEPKDSEASIGHGPIPRPSSPTDMRDLQAQLVELRRERDELAKAKQAAEDAALAKAGEIAIVRANQTKTERIYESKIQALQRLRQDEAAKQRLEVERALAEKQKIATETVFLQNDIAEGNQQIKSLQRAVKAKDTASTAISAEKAGRPAGETAEPTTPSKKKSVKHADGFDYNEIQPQLPYRSKNNTPKGSKRKRKAIRASPVKPLQFSQAHDVSEPLDVPNLTTEQSAANPTAAPAAPSAGSDPPLVPPNDRNFKLAQHVMNHRMDSGAERTFEALSAYAYPSNPNRALSTIFLDKMSALTSEQNAENFSSALAQIPVSMWKQCVEEQFWKPVHLLLDLTTYILCITPVTTAPLLVDTLLEVIQSTADVNLIPRVRRQSGNFSAEVNIFNCLELLKTLAVDCSSHEEDIIRFWRYMRFDFIAMILNVVQPMEELHLTLELLRRSVLKETFAMIVPSNDGKQEPSEMNLIDLLSRLLVEPLRPPKDGKPYSTVEIADLRLNVLSLMDDMCENKHSSLALASSQHVIGRLVWVMNDELDALYNRGSAHEEKAEMVNQATRILFRLRTDHPQVINMQEKLKILPGSGGVHKHLIALTRLALSEGVFYEENIEDDVVECAYEMLEDLSSPEEAEALREAFSTARSRETNNTAGDS